MYAKQVEAYRAVQKTTMSGRELEASVLTKGALMLQQCRDNWSAEDLGEQLNAALKYNQMIWTVFQGELAKPENPLPKKLREDLLSLGLFIDKRIFDIMAFPAQEKLSAIININLNLAAGLRGQPA